MKIGEENYIGDGLWLSRVEGGFELEFNKDHKQRFNFWFHEQTARKIAELILESDEWRHTKKQAT